MPDTEIVDITTNWPNVLQTQNEDESVAREAMACMIQQYSGAIRRYVRVFFRDPNNADDVYQKFAERLTKGDLRNASPEKGSFRVYLKAVLRNLIRSHQAEIRKHSPSLMEQFPEGCEDDPIAARMEDERHIWREELIGRAWQHLETQEHARGRDLPHHVLLHYRSEHPDASLAEIASHFSLRSGTEISEVKIRGLLHEARRALRHRTYVEVAETLAFPTVDNVEEEIIDLGLHKWLASTIREIRGRK